MRRTSCAPTRSACRILATRAPGSPLCYAYIKVNLCSAPGTVGIVKGGMGGITQAMARAARQAGVDMRTGVEVAQVLIDKGEARGVVLRSGEVIHSTLTVSNADPKRTFLSLVPPDRTRCRLCAAGQAYQHQSGVSQVPCGATRAAGLLAVPGQGF